jgi:predicted nucleic acid-binding protein
MVIYADTSALVPLYVDEEQSQTIDRYVASLDEGLVFTPFHRLELRTALRLRVFRKESTNEELKGALRQVDEHVRVDLLRHVPLDWNDALRKAETIAAAHLIQVGARSGDLLHVASALVLDATEFCTFDQHQAVLAKRAGLKVRAWR